MSDNEALFYSQNLMYASGTIGVQIPFICLRCGKCCREVSVQLAAFDIQRGAGFLGLSVEDFITQYLGEIKKVEKEKIEFDRTKSWKPCQFLSSSNMCTIYEVRPLACRSFPLETDFGERGIGCPGYKQVRKVMHTIGQGVPYFVGTPSKSNPIQLKWKRIYKKFLKVKPSDKMKQAFIRINNIPTEFTL
jgi:Fe-S-cluster containining protein